MSSDRALSHQETGHATPFHKWGSLVILSLALAIIIIDTTLLNVSLSTIIRDLNTDIQKLQWVISAYALTLAALTITGGRLGDLFGRKRMFLLGAVLFGIGSFVASISHGFTTLLAGESIIEGIGAALMMPATSSLLLSTFRGKERAIAFGVWGGIAAASSAVGPILGGFLTSHYSWRWGFRINIFVVLLLLIGSVLVNESRDEEHKPTLDWLGVILSSTGMLSVLFGIIESSKYGWWRMKEAFVVAGHSLTMGNLSIVPVSLVLGAVLLILFIHWQDKIEKLGRTPLVSVHLFQNQQFRSGTITTAVLSLGQAGLIFAVPVFLQAVRGYDAFHTGLALLPLSISLMIVAPLGALLSNKIAPKRLIQFGLALNVIALFYMRSLLSVDATPLSLAPAMVIYGIGMGLVMAQITNLTLSAVPVSMGGEASGINNTGRQLGSALGSAIIGAVLLTTLTTHFSDGVKSSSVFPETMKSDIVRIVAEQGSRIEFAGVNSLPNTISPAIKSEFIRINQESTTAGNKTALLYAALFSLLGFLVSFNLPGVKNVESVGKSAKA